MSRILVSKHTPAKPGARRGLMIGRMAAVVALAGLALTGCGRRGDLEAPPGAPSNAVQAEDDRIGSDIIDGAPPVRRGKIVPPRGPFILDKIL